MTRYIRQTCLPEVGSAGQASLAAARVLVVGAGGLGSTLLPLLAGAGVGHLRIFDPDLVEETNLHRQTLFRMQDIGRPKALAAAQALSALNPDIQVLAVPKALDPAQARQEILSADLVIDAADLFTVTYALSDICRDASKPLVSASVLRRSGHVGAFCASAPSYRAVFPDLPAVLQTCATGGVMGPAVATLAALQAQMALSILLGHDPSPLGQMILLDLASWRMTTFRFDGAPEPAPALPLILAASDLAADDLVLDLRSAHELPELPLPQAQRLDPAEVALLSPPPGQRVVFVCAAGVRAWRAARALAARGHDRVAILGTLG